MVYSSGYEYKRDVYIWKKYTIKSTEAFVEDRGTMNVMNTVKDIFEDNTKSITANPGFDSSFYIVQSGPNQGKIIVLGGFLYYWSQKYKDSSSNGYYTDEEWSKYPYICLRDDYGDVYPTVYYVVDANTAYIVGTKRGTLKEKGTYIEDVYATDESTYPINGEQDGYWYVYDQFGTITVTSEYKIVEGSSQTLLSSSGGASSTWFCYSTLGVLEDGTIFANESEGTSIKTKNLPSSRYPYTFARGKCYRIDDVSGGFLYKVYGVEITTSKE